MARGESPDEGWVGAGGGLSRMGGGGLGSGLGAGPGAGLGAESSGRGGIGTKTAGLGARGGLGSGSSVAGATAGQGLGRKQGFTSAGAVPLDDDEDDEPAVMPSSFGRQ